MNKQKLTTAKQELLTAIQEFKNQLVKLPIEQIDVEYLDGLDELVFEVQMATPDEFPKWAAFWDSLHQTEKKND